MTNLNELAKAIHTNAVNHGWWETDRDTAEIIALIHSEWSEALEQYRDGRPMLYYKCDSHDTRVHCTDKYDGCQYGANAGCSRRKLEGIAVELIDGCIRILDFLASENIALPEERDTITDLIQACDKGLDRHSAQNLKDLSLPQLVTALHWYVAGVQDKGVVTLMEAFSFAVLWIKRQNLDPEAILMEKHRYNIGRPYRHGGKRC